MNVHPNEMIYITVNGNPYPTYMREDGKQCFVPNGVLAHLSEHRNFQMNLIGDFYFSGAFSLEALQEFYMMIGYPVEGFYEIFGPDNLNFKPAAQISNPLWSNWT